MLGRPKTPHVFRRIQFLVFLLLNAAVGVITWLHCRKADRGTNEAREYFLASSSLTWAFIAGSITLTNINTDTFVGMNGSQALIMFEYQLVATPPASARVRLTVQPPGLPLAELSSSPGAGFGVGGAQAQDLLGQSAGPSPRRAT